MEYQSKLKFLINLGFYFSVAAIIFVCGKFLLGYFLPVIIASIIAVAVQKPAGKIATKVKLKKGICAAALSAFLFALFAFLVCFLFYKSASKAGGMLNELNGIADYISLMFENIELNLKEFLNRFPPQFSNMINKMGTNLLDSLIKAVTDFFSYLATNLATKTPQFLFSFVVTLVASCYIAKDYDILVKFIKELCGADRFEKLIEIKEIFAQNVLKIIKGYLLLMVITLLELAVGFLILRVKHPILLAVLIALVDLLPVFGTGTVLIPWSLISISMGDSKGFGILLIYIIITLARNFIEPKVIGKQIGINPLFTLIVMFAGLRIMGFFGIFVFPIVFIVTVKYYKHQLENEREEN